MSDSYSNTRGRLETYFDQTASKTWERLTSDAPVSKIRQTVRNGRDAMRATLLSQIPEDLRGARVLDAGCGTGAMSEVLAERGARVLATDISPSLLEIARQRMPEDLSESIDFVAGDMLDPDLGAFDFVIAMDSLIHYAPSDTSKALSELSKRTRERILFTIAPKTPMLSAMHLAGKIFPRSDRSPAIVPMTGREIEAHLSTDWTLSTGQRVNTAFYKSQSMELHP